MRVTDADGSTATATASVTVNNLPPTVTITAPANNSAFDFGTNINFVANATDAGDDNATLTASIAWTSSISGVLGSGGSINVSTLPVGVHTITASVTDSGGESGSASINLTIQNTAPTADAQSLTTDEDIALPITLTGSDPESAPLTYAIETTPANGALSGTAPNITYTPNTITTGRTVSRLRSMTAA